MLSDLLRYRWLNSYRYRWLNNNRYRYLLVTVTAVLVVTVTAVLLVTVTAVLLVTVAAVLYNVCHVFWNNHTRTWTSFCWCSWTDWRLSFRTFLRSAYCSTCLGESKVGLC